MSELGDIHAQMLNRIAELVHEIDRLRAELRAAQLSATALDKQIKQLRAHNATLLAALRGMLDEWERLSRYGSPMAKAANPRVNAARAAIAANVQAAPQP